MAGEVARACSGRPRVVEIGRAAPPTPCAPARCVRATSAESASAPIRTAEVEAAADQVDLAVVERDVELDLGMEPGELGQRRREIARCRTKAAR